MEDYDQDIANALRLAQPSEAAREAQRIQAFRDQQAADELRYAPKLNMPSTAQQPVQPVQPSMMDRAWSAATGGRNFQNDMSNVSDVVPQLRQMPSDIATAARESHEYANQGVQNMGQFGSPATQVLGAGQYALGSAGELFSPLTGAIRNIITDPTRRYFGEPTSQRADIVANFVDPFSPVATVKAASLLAAPTLAMATIPAKSKAIETALQVANQASDLKTPEQLALETAKLPENSVDALITPPVTQPLIQTQKPEINPLTYSFSSIENVLPFEFKFNNPPPPDQMRSSVLNVINESIKTSNGETAKLPTSLGLGTPYLMNSGIGIVQGQKPLVTLTTTNKNAPKQLDAITNIRAKYPNMGVDLNQWNAGMSEAYASTNIPIAPFNFMKGMNDGSFVTMLKNMTPGQVEMRRLGFQNGKDFLNQYTTGNVNVETTGKLFMWGILSRGVNPYTHEGLFIDAFHGVEPYIKAAAEGKFADVADSYREWATSTAPKGSGQPGAGAMHNLNAFGEDFLTKMGTPGEDGVTPMQKLHNLMSDPTKSGRDIRREFAKIGEGVGIDNKVVSFILLATGRDDVLVIDRIQLDNMFNDGRFNDMNIWDGVSVPGVEMPTTKKTIKFDPTDEGRAAAQKLISENEGAKSKKVAVTGSSLAEMTYGAKGILTYEAIEDALKSRISDMYTAAGRPQDASVGGFHWDTWVAKSNQEASHGTLSALLAEAKKQPNPLSGVYSRQGDYQTYAYGAKYFKDENNKPYFMMPLSDGSEVYLSSSEMMRLQEELRDSTKGAVPVPTPYVVNPVTGVRQTFENSPKGRQNALEYKNQLVDQLRQEARKNNLPEDKIRAINIPVGEEKFSVESVQGRPWYEEPSINRERVDKLINDAAQRSKSSRQASAQSSQSAVPNVAGRPDNPIKLARNAVGFDEGLPRTYERIDGGTSKRVVTEEPPEFDAQIANVFRINPKAAVEYQKAGHSTPTIYELNTKNDAGIKAGQSFYDAIAASKEQNKFGAAVYLYSPDEYSQMRLFLTPDGTSGFALKGDDIVSVFNKFNGPNKRVANPMLDLAIAAGGRKLDAYDTILPEIYGDSGFRTTSRQAFNPQFKPDDWDYNVFNKFNQGKPDVIHMVYDPRHEGGYELSEGKFFKDYDEAVNEQTSNVKATSNYLDRRASDLAKENFQKRMKMVGLEMLDRDPVLEQGVKDLADGYITPQDWDKMVATRKPVAPYLKESIPQPATPEAAIDALDAGKKEKFGKANEYYKLGDKVMLRLDIPAYKKGVWVNAIHGAHPTTYESAAAATNVKFNVTEDKAFSTATGTGKAPYATMDGNYKPISPEEAYAQALKLVDDKQWIQVSMDPTRHSFFYSRKDMKPVVSAEEVLQIGPLVFAKKPTYGKRANYKFNQGGRVGNDSSIDHALKLAHYYSN